MNSLLILLKGIFCSSSHGKTPLNVFKLSLGKNIFCPEDTSLELGKKSSKVVAAFRVSHTASSYGVHITETTEQPFTGMLLIMYIFLLYFVVFL